MSTLPRYRQDIVDNPIQRHERDHLRRERISWFSRGMYVIAIFAMIAPILWGFNAYFLHTVEAVVIFLLMMNGIAIFAVEMRLIGDSAESFRREFQGKTWNLLILTGVDTWRLVLGKWLGVIRGHRRSILFLYMLRFITFIWGMGWYYLSQNGFNYDRWDHTSSARLWDLQLEVSVILTVALIMAVYLALEIMLVAALPMALSLFSGSRKGATWAALGLRIVIPIGFAVSLGFIFGELPYTLRLVERGYLIYPDTVNTVFLSLGLVLLDNGLLLSAVHVGDIYIVGRDITNKNLWDIFAFMQFLGIGLYLLWIWIMLRLAKFAAGRMNVSAPGFEPKIKPKHPDRYKMQMETTPVSIQQPQVRNVPKVQVYRCELVRYDRETAQLDIAVYTQGEDKPDHAIRFTSVSYFTGMMRWRTTNTRVTTDDNLQRFAEQQHIDYDRLSGDAKLYELQAMDSPIYVIASGVSKSF